MVGYKSGPSMSSFSMKAYVEKVENNINKVRRFNNLYSSLYKLTERRDGEDDKDFSDRILRMTNRRFY